MSAATADRLETDVLIVGGGFAGLACAIRLARASEGKLSVMLLEKASRIGGHLLSGAVLRPRALDRLLTPEERGALPLGPVVVADHFHALLPGFSLRLPFVPPKMRMKGLPMLDVGAVARALAEIAAGLGVEIITSQTADALLWDGDRVAGVASDGDEIGAGCTVLAEGPAGLLAAELLKRNPALRGPNLQTYAVGVKEVLEVPADPDKTGRVLHTFGWPLPWSLYGGGFLYRTAPDRIALGLAVALDSTDPGFDPHELFRRWKTHPLIRRETAGGKPVAYGARLIPEGGWFSRTAPAAPGVRIVGDAAGLVDAMELKGLHLAIESGIDAADGILRDRGLPVPADALPPGDGIPSLDGLRRTKNYRAAFRGGLPVGMGMAGLAWITRGLLPPGRIAQRDERHCLRPAKAAPPAPRPESGPLDLGIDSDLYLANLSYRDGTPSHISIPDPSPCRDCIARYGAPCTRFCPAAVYERAPDGAPADAPPIRIRHENCLQCRTCTLKCPSDAIRWTTPVHGNGPDFRGL